MGNRLKMVLIKTKIPTRKTLGHQWWASDKCIFTFSRFFKKIKVGIAVTWNRQINDDEVLK